MKKLQEFVRNTPLMLKELSTDQNKWKSIIIFMKMIWIDHFPSKTTLIMTQWERILVGQEESKPGDSIRFRNIDMLQWLFKS